MTLMFEPLPTPPFRQGVAQRIAPFRQPALLGVSPYLSGTRLAEIAIDVLAAPQQTPDLCPVRPAISAPHLSLVSPEVENLTPWFAGQQLEPPSIESLFVPLKRAARAGKCYGEQEWTAEQSIAPQAYPDERCKHELRKSQCSICSGQQQRAKAKTKLPRSVDVFDLIYPILMPPLGENLDNSLILPSPLYPFQREGVRWLADKQAALLGDEMGLGKTIQAIVAARLLIRNGTIGNALVLCPKAVLRNWEREFETWAVELHVNVLSGAKECRQELWKTPAHVYLVTYDTWREDHADSGIPRFDLCILDEAQRIKNPSTATTRAVRKIQAKYRWGLSGTPLENRQEDLTSIFEFIKPGLFHAILLCDIRELIKPYFLRRRKVDVLQDLPEKRRDDIWLEMEPAQRQAYERAEKEGIVTISEEGDRATVHHVLALITKLKQICNLDLESGESCKLDYLMDQLEEISEQGDKALVFSQFPEQTLIHLEPPLEQFGPLRYHGGLTESQRNDVLSRFKDDESYKVLLISTRAGGLGLNLTEANHVFHFDLWWNPATTVQAEDRTHRVGQKKGVFVQSLLTKDTIEERIQQILERKGRLFKYFIDDLSETDVRNALSEEELFGLFGLQKPSHRSPGTGSYKIDGQIDLDALSPEAFEKLVGDLYERMGYKVKITPLTNDGGIDVHALLDSDAGRQRLAIQCKHCPGGSVDVKVARELAGVLSDQQDITKGVIVTSGRFTSGCEELSSKHRIELVDRPRLLSLLYKYDININR